MKIGIDVRSIGKNRTGDETYISNLVSNLSLFDQENQYFLFTDVKDTTFIEPFRCLPTNFKIVSILPANKFLWTMFLLPLRVMLLKLDILHVLYITPLFLLGKTKLITTIHDVSWRTYPKSIPHKDLFFFKHLIPRSIKRADLVLTISENSRNDILSISKRINPNKVKTVYIGGYVKKEDHSGPFIRRKWGDIEPNKYLLYIGTLQPRKNVPALINAYIEMYRLYSSNLDYFPRLVIVGGRIQNYDNRIDFSVAAFPQKNLVIFPGYVSEKDKHIILKNASVFVYPSLYEGFGIPPLEAMSLSIPTIVSNRSCLPEIVGNGACVIDPDDISAFAEALFNLYTDQAYRKTLIETGLLRANRYSWKNMAKQTFEIYQQLFNDNLK